MKTYRDDPVKIEADTFDEYTTRDESRQKSFFDRYGFDERDGPPEQENEDRE